MRSSKCRVLVSLFVVLTVAGLASTTLVSQERDSAQEQLMKKENSAALAVVQNYLSLSAAGKFEDVARLTISIPKGAEKKPAVPTAATETANDLPSGIAVITSTGSGVNLTLGWIRKDFPQSVFKNKQRIFKVGDILVKNNFAKVSVNLGDNQTHSLLPWVFILAKEEDGGQWRIYDIKTPAYAVDYNP